MKLTTNVSGSESCVELRSLLFDRIEYARDIDQAFNGNLDSSFAMEVKKSEDTGGCEGERTVRITFVLFDEGEEGIIRIIVRLIGTFYIVATDPEQFDTLLNYNTVAMMMPYVRSQISLLTSQPGLTPLVLPAFDIYKLVNNSKEILERVQEISPIE